MDEKKNVLARLLAVQQDLKAPKGQYNSFGKYKYRSCEDILQAARPLCNANGLILSMRDSIECIGNRYYIKAEVTVTDIDSGETFSTQAMAREEDSKKGMDGAQVTGASSSYARKYALCAMFAIDDTKDADTDEYARQNAQNRPQQAKPQQEYNPPAGVQKGAENGDMRNIVLKRLIDTAKQNGIGNDVMKVLISGKYDKDSTKEMTLDEICDLANNLLKYFKELEASVA